MITITQNRLDVNVEALDAAIRNTVPSTLGLAWDGKDVTVYFDDDATSDQIAQIRRLVQQHDATQLSERQQLALERKLKLQELRSVNSTALDESEYAKETEIIRKLVYRVTWLEQEILAIRQGED